MSPGRRAGAPGRLLAGRGELAGLVLLSPRGFPVSPGARCSSCSSSAGRARRCLARRCATGGAVLAGGALRCSAVLAPELGDRCVQRSEVPEVELLGGARGPAVARDHRVRLVPRAIRDPRFGAPEGEGHGHESRSQVVNADRLSRRASLEQLRAIDAGALEVRPKLVRLVVPRDGEHAPRGAASDRAAVVLRFGRGEEDAPPGEGLRHVRPERPRARVVGLVFVQPHHAPGEVEIAPFQGFGLARSHAFPVEKAVQNAPRERHAGAREKGRVLARIEPRQRLSRSAERHPTGRNRVRREEPQREHRELDQAMHDVCDVLPRRAREAGRERREHRLCVIQRKQPVRHRYVADHRQDVLFEAVTIDLVVALRNVVGEARREIVAGPLPGELAEGRNLRRERRGLAPDECLDRCGTRRDVARPFAAREPFQERQRQRQAPRGSQARREAGEKIAPLDRSGFGRDGWSEREASPAERCAKDETHVRRAPNPPDRAFPVRALCHLPPSLRSCRAASPRDVPLHDRCKIERRFSREGVRSERVHEAERIAPFPE